jgi:hypothetical protein
MKKNAADKRYYRKVARETIERKERYPFSPSNRDARRIWQEELEKVGRKK